MKNTGLVATVGLAATLLAASAAHAQQPPFLIGEIAPLSGPAATVGTRLNQAAIMWVEDVNRQGGINGRKVELTTCNDEARPDKAVVCARDLVAKGSMIIINDSLTASILATMPVVANGPVMIVPSPNVTPPPESYVFQVSPSDLSISTAVANYMKSNGLKRIGMVAATDSSGEVGIVNANKIFPPAGIELKSARIDLRSTDASSQLAAVAGGDTKLVYSSYSGAGAATVVKSFYNLGLQQPLMVSYANLSTSFIAAVKDMLPPRLLGTAITSLVPDALPESDAKQRSLAFAKAYKARFNEPMDMVNLLGKLNVDTVDAILRNVKDPTDVKAVKAYLQSNAIPSVQNIRFSATSNVGLTDADIMIVELKNGVWAKADPIK